MGWTADLDMNIKHVVQDRFYMGTLEDPLVQWKKIILTALVVQYTFENYVLLRQYRVLQNDKRPAAIASHVDEKTYARSQAYARAKARVDFIVSTVRFVLEAMGIHFDVIYHLWTLASEVSDRPGTACRARASVLRFLLFNLLLQVIRMVPAVMTLYYRTFSLEARFGFNKYTPKSWVKDYIKLVVFGSTLQVAIAGGQVLVVANLSHALFYSLYLFYGFVTALITTLTPTVIIPLVNKLTPLDPSPLTSRITALATKAHFPLSYLVVMDGSKQSAHSNALFTGPPWTKRIVLFDTLLAQQTEPEIEAIVAHELGHWAGNHVVKMLGVLQIFGVLDCLVFMLVMGNRSFHAAFGFGEEGAPVEVAVVLQSVLMGRLTSLILGAVCWVSRGNEFQADAYAAKMGYAKDMVSALVKLTKDNLISTEGDWLYSALHNTHPTLMERIRALEKVDKEVEKRE